LPTSLGFCGFADYAGHNSGRYEPISRRSYIMRESRWHWWLLLQDHRRRNSGEATRRNQVAAGTYAEDVVIGKPLSLVGANPNTTIIDATGLSNAVYVNGLDNAKLSGVVVQGFTAENANFEGILITNASNITVWNNNVLNNDKALDLKNGTCPGIPPFETAESFDCREGLHLIGVAFSTVANNTGGAK
jgi:parallel beta-helix repeat protein